MAKLVISTLGAMQITDGKSPLSGFLSDKVRGLLIYLAVEQARPFRREALAALFWPDQPEKGSRANLRRALANLRLVIDDENDHFLLITRQTLQFNAASNAVVDAIRFEQLLSGREPSVVQMKEAASLVNGCFLENFSIHGCIAFEEWVLLNREHIQRQFLTSLNHLTAFYEKHYRLDEAIRYCWQQVKTEPWYEPGQRQLLRLLAHTGQRASALSHYEQFQKELAAELDIMPEPATRRLYEQIREGQTGDAGQTETAPPFLAEPRATTPAPFVAFESELNQLRSYLQTAIDGQGRIVFVTGEAGSGKTSILQTFARQVQSQYAKLITLFGECLPHLGQGSPYLPFRTILARSVGDIESQWYRGTLNRDQASRLWFLRQTAVQLLQNEAPDLLANFVDPIILPSAARSATGAPVPSKDVLFQQITRFLQKFSQNGPLLLLLDDLQWVDRGTIDLLYHLRRQLAGYPILIAGSYRPEEVITNQPESGQRHPLASLVHELTRDFGEIEVALNQTNGRSFVDAWLDTEPNRFDETFRNTLYRKTLGNPLFTVELVAGMQERGEVIRNQDGYWLVGETTTWDHLPAKVEAIIAERIGRLPQSMRHLLKAAAIQGSTFAAEMIAEVLDRRPQEVIQHLSGDLGRTHRLVQVHGQQQMGEQSLSWYRFRHDLFQHYIYSRIDSNERAYLHHLTGELLESFYAAGEVDLMTVAVQLAYHFGEAQAIAKAAHYHQLAGQHSLRLSAHVEAIGHFRQSLALSAKLTETPQRIYQEVECQLALGAALLPIQGYASLEVKQVYDRAYTLCLQLAAAPELVTSLFWLASYFAVSGQLEQALVVAQQMLAITEEETVSDLEKIQAHVLNGLPLFFMGRNEEALTHFEQGSALYDPQRHQPHVYTIGQDPGIASKIWQGHALLHMGFMAEARRCLDQALALTATLDHPYTAAFTSLLAGCTPNYWYLGREEEKGIKYAQATIELAQKGDFVHLRALGMYYLGIMTVAANVNRADKEVKEKVTEGFELIHQGLELEESIGSKLGVSSRWVLLADAYRQTGQLEKAWQAVRYGEQEINSRHERYFESELLRIKGELYIAAEDERMAETCWQQAVEIARQQKARSWELKVTNNLCRLWRRQGKRAKAHRLMAYICGCFAGDLITPELQEARGCLAALKSETAANNSDLSSLQKTHI